MLTASTRPITRSLAIQRILITVCTLLAILPVARAQIDVADVTVVSTPVTKITMVDCGANVDVVDPSIFQAGDRVLIHQAKGMIVTTAIADSGRPGSQEGAGNFEFATVRTVTGNTVVLTTPLLRSYDVDAAVQLVPVISSSRVSIRGTVSATPWNGSSGGIVAIEATEEVTLSRSISVDAVGFRGGIVSQPYNACGRSTAMSIAHPSTHYAQKGEGAANVSNAFRAGRASCANGGGGGANHNAGGGGGGNGGFGGHGGAVYGVCGVERNGGLGGAPCTNDPGDPRAYFGGAGGGGHQNERAGSAGGYGGGILIIVAPQIVVDAWQVTLSANGGSAGNTQHDGAGGGGAGGTIYLGANSIVGTMDLEVKGGQGGSVNASFQRPHGPGGGGSGGQIMCAAAMLPTNVSVVADGGASGVNTNFPNGVEHTWYSEPGESGTVVTSCVLREAPPPSSSTITMRTSPDLGTTEAGSQIIYDLRFVNDGPDACILDSATVADNLGKISFTSPTLPMLWGVGDEVAVRVVYQCPAVGEFLDFITLHTTNGGCVDHRPFELRWSVYKTEEPCDTAVFSLLTSEDLGNVEVGSQISIDLRFVNDGPDACLLDSVHLMDNLGSVLFTTPTLPMFIDVGEEVMVRVVYPCPAVGEFVDSITLYTTNGACVAERSFGLQWSVYKKVQPCHCSVKIKDDSVDVGGRFTVRAEVISTIGVTPPVSFTAYLRYASSVLYVPPAEQGVSIVFDDMSDVSSVTINGTWDGGTNLFTVQALGLLAHTATTTIALDSLWMSNGGQDCTTDLWDGQIDLYEVCATRPLRVVSLAVPQFTLWSRAGELVVERVRTAQILAGTETPQIVIWSTSGREVHRQSLTRDLTGIDLSPGVYVVQITGAGAPSASLVAVY